MPVPDRDFWLAELIALMYETGLSYGITFTFPGLTISGVPIKPEEFVRLSGQWVVEEMRHSQWAESAASFESYFERQAKVMADTLTEAQQNLSKLSEQYSSNDENARDDVITGMYREKYDA